MALVGNGCRTADLYGHLCHQPFGQIHQVFVSGVGLIEFEHREFRVVLAGNAFVSEVAVYLKYPVESTHDQPFQIELRRNAQVQVHAQRVVEGFERCGFGATGNRLHHRCLDFEKIALKKILTHRLNGLRSPQKNLSHIGIHDQVDIALTIALLRIFETVKFFRQGTNRFAKQDEHLDQKRPFSGFGLEQGAGEPDDIADIQLFEEIVGQVADLVFANIRLHLAGVVSEAHESGLSKAVDGHHASGRNEFRTTLAAVGSRLLHLPHDIRDRMEHFEIIWVNVYRLRPQVAYFAAPLFKNIACFFRAHFLPATPYPAGPGDSIVGSAAVHSRCRDLGGGMFSTWCPGPQLIRF